MKSRIFKSLTAIFLLTCMVFSIFGCQKKCDHQWETKSTTEATCTAEGSVWKVCSHCGEILTESIPKTEHTKKAELSCDQENHWCVCSVCEGSYNVEAHVWGEYNTCTVCDYTKMFVDPT